MDEKSFIIKANNKNINVIPCTGNAEKAVADFIDYYSSNMKKFNGISEFHLLYDGKVSYKSLADAEEKGVYFYLDKQDRSDGKKEAERIKIIKRMVRSGEQINFDGDIVVEGNVNQDAFVMATGDIYILGTLRGVAHAGCRGDKDKKIVVLNYEDAQVRIAHLDKAVRNKKKAISSAVFFMGKGNIEVKDIKNL